MRIVDLRATTVAVPREAPLRHANGVHRGRFIGTIVEVIDEERRIGWDETGGCESAEAVVLAMKPYLAGHEPLPLEQLRWKRTTPAASLYDNPIQVHAAIEMACIDLAGRQHDPRPCDLLGGAIRENVKFADHLYYRYASEDGGSGEEITADEIVAHACGLREKHGFMGHKLMGGHYAFDHDIEVIAAPAEAVPGERLRLHPDGVWSVGESLRMASGIGHLPNDCFEDHTWGLEGMRRLREPIPIPMATNQVVANFEQLTRCIRHSPADVILLDTTFRGGPRQACEVDAVLETFQVSAAVHSPEELGIRSTSMLHLGAALTDLNFAADADCHRLSDDILVGGPLQYRDSAIAGPKGPGPGVEVDRDKLARYAEHFREVGGHAFDRDPGRPDRFATLPATRVADPALRSLPSMAEAA